MKIYNFNNEFEYIRISDLPETQQKEFTEFMSYQTRPYIPKHEDAVFSWDYYNWIEIKSGKKGYWD